MAHQEKVLQLIRIKGPVIPSQISQDIGTDILLASAILSEMVAKNVLRISSVKIGGSPLYYLPGQEQRLQEHASRLHEKEKQAYDLLKEKKVLRDKELAAVIRVALRQIKDFAKPLEVSAGDDKELFWKWYLLPTEETEPLIKSILTGPEATTEETKEEVKKAEVEEEIAPLQKQSVTKARKRAAEDYFSKRIRDYLGQNKIEVIEENMKKKSEAEFIVWIPSTVGKLKYYIKAKNKKRCNDADLSAAYVQGQSKKLPVLFLTTGEFTKKAKEMFNKEFSHITLKKI